MPQSQSVVVGRAMIALAPQRGTPVDHASGTNAVAMITYPARPNGRNVIDGIAFGYDNTPSAGYVDVSVGGVSVFRVPVTNAGAGFIPIKRRSGVNQVMTVSIGAGGAGIRGDINVCNYWYEEA